MMSLSGLRTIRLMQGTSCHFRSRYGKHCARPTCLALDTPGRSIRRRRRARRPQIGSPAVREVSGRLRKPLSAFAMSLSPWTRTALNSGAGIAAETAVAGADDAWVWR